MSATIFVHLAGSKAWNATPGRFICGEDCPPRLRERAQAELDASEGSVAGFSLAVLMPALASSVPAQRVAAAEAAFYELTDRCDKMAQYMDHVVPDAALGLIRVEPCKGCLANVGRILSASGKAAAQRVGTGWTTPPKPAPVAPEAAQAAPGNAKRVRAGKDGAKGGKAGKDPAVAASKGPFAAMGVSDAKWWDTMTRTKEAPAGSGAGSIVTSVPAPAARPANGKPADPRQAKADKRWSTPARAKPAKAKLASKAARR